MAKKCIKHMHLLVCLACLEVDSPHLPWQHRDFFPLAFVPGMKQVREYRGRTWFYRSEHQNGISRSIVRW